MNRRSFLLGLLSTTAAPVIARAVPDWHYVVRCANVDFTEIVELLVKQNAEFITMQMEDLMLYGNSSRIFPSGLDVAVRDPIAIDQETWRQIND